MSEKAPLITGAEARLRLIRRLPLTALIGAGLAALAACGGGSGGGVNSTPSGTTTATATATATASPTATATATSTPIAGLTPTPAASFQTAEYTKSTGPSQHGAITAWAMGASGQGVTIGIVDSGLDTTTNEFTGRVSSASTDVAGSRTYSNPDDPHGTIVAQVAAAARNSSGIMGIAYNATVAMFRADTPGSCTSSSGCSFDDSAIASGITKAVAAGARVINLSLGGSTPSAAVTNAVTQAASSGVVIVVSAGNDSTANPDPFATALLAAGSGNVIIAGSVNSSNVISSFSNRAGTAASAYLAALGESICCLYANGQIKYTQSNGTTYYTVYDGTSYSAPQIAGAVALLLQAYPNLTAAQAVQILLTSATHEGTSATGTADSVYGMGVLNIAAAFSAQGATSLGSRQIALTDATSITSAAMGDAAYRASLKAVVLDSYNRAFGVDLASGLHSAQIAPRLTTALTSRQTQMTTGGGRLALAFTVDSSAAQLNQPWTGALRLSGEDAAASRVLAARMVAQISAHTALGFAYSAGAEGLVAQLQGQDRPAFLMAGNPLEDTGFVRMQQTSLAVRHALGLWGLTVSAEQGKGQVGAPWIQPGPLTPMQRDDSISRLGLAADRRWGPIEAALGASWLAEQQGVLGARFNPALGAHGADSVFVDASLGWRPIPDFHMGAAWRQGYTQMHTSSLIEGSSRLVSNGWVVDAALANALKPGDMLSLRVSQPLRVASGGADLWLPIAYSYDTRALTWGTRSLGLSPTGREITGEIAWGLPLWGGTGSTNLFWRHNPGNYADLPMERGWSLGWKRGF